MIIQSERIYIDGCFRSAQLDLRNGKIFGINAYNTMEPDVDYGSSRILPGFYDVHTHGYGGFDTNDAEPEGLKRWLKALPSEGVCGLCPTTVTQSFDVLSAACRNVAQVKDSCPSGAEILGIHFEGPYLDKAYKGAQPEEFCVSPSVEEFKKYQDAARGLIKIITLAPEHDKGFKLCEYCGDNGVRVSLGHSGASFETARDAIAHGAKSFTHVYNGMSPFKHRENGMVGAALMSDECYAELICDGNHSTLDAIRLFFRAKPKNRTIMISDSLLAKDLPVGQRMMFGGQEIEVYPDESCRLSSTGGLAGSTLKLNKGLKLLVEKVGIDFDWALSSCTINPMRYLALADRKGLIKVEYDANITVLDDDYNVLSTYVAGKKEYASMDK